MYKLIRENPNVIATKKTKKNTYNSYDKYNQKVYLGTLFVKIKNT